MDKPDKQVTEKEVFWIVSSKFFQIRAVAHESDIIWKCLQHTI